MKRFYNWLNLILQIHRRQYALHLPPVSFNSFSSLDIVNSKKDNKTLHLSVWD